MTVQTLGNMDQVTPCFSRCGEGREDEVQRVIPNGKQDQGMGALQLGFEQTLIIIN